MLYSTSAHRGMDAVLADFRPDVVHLHNIYHQLSPSVLRPVARRRVPAVMTLHDYKLACPTYQFLDHGNLCQACLGGHFQHAILRRCKDGSLGSSAVMAVELFTAHDHACVRARSRLHLPEPFPGGTDARCRGLPGPDGARAPLHRDPGHPREAVSRERRAHRRPALAGEGRRRRHPCGRRPSTERCSMWRAPAPRRHRCARRGVGRARTRPVPRPRRQGCGTAPHVAAAVVVVRRAGTRISRWSCSRRSLRGVPVVGSDLGGHARADRARQTGDLVPPTTPRRSPRRSARTLRTRTGSRCAIGHEPRSRRTSLRSSISTGSAPCTRPPRRRCSSRAA